MSYVQCQGCDLIHREAELPGRVGPKNYGGHRNYLVEIPFCPECSGERFEPIKGVCDRCEKALAIKGDDYCATCALLVDAQDEADFHADNAAEPGFHDGERHEIVVTVDDHLNERRIA